MDKALEPEVASKMTVVELVRPEGEVMESVFVSGEEEARVVEVFPEESVGEREPRVFATPEAYKETGVLERAFPKASFNKIEILDWLRPLAKR